MTSKVTKKKPTQEEEQMKGNLSERAQGALLLWIGRPSAIAIMQLTKFMTEGGGKT